MEIGSEFWEFEDELKNDNKDFWNFGQDVKFTLSGRTSIYYVLKNILKNKEIKKAYLPSYSCFSMTKPFLDLGIEVEYYDVYYNEGLKYNIEFREDIDIFLAMNYFGYSNTNMGSYIQKFKALGKIVIEDITHSIFSSKKYSEYSDYLIGSLRKWFPIASGAIAVSRNSKFEIDLEKNTNEKMIDIKKVAMKNKKDYIEKSDNIEKETFLNQYSESGKILEDDYKNYSIDDESFKIIMGIDLETIKKSRIENTKVIYNKLKNNANVKFLVNDYNEDDGLLFVPIILEKEKRDSLRKYLIENKIYLPVHWPQEEQLNNIFENELSLICDQRYTSSQIGEYIDLLVEFLDKI